MARLTPDEIEQGRQMLQAGPGRGSPAFSATDPRRLDIAQPPAPPAAPSMLQSAGRGAAQGITMGYGDEIAGAGGAVGNVLNKTGINPGVVAAAAPALAALMVLAGSKSKDESISDTYKRIRDSERAANAAAKDANPATYATTDILGSLVPTLLAPELKAGAAVVGGAMALGHSDADNLKDAAANTAAGAIGGQAGKVLASGAGALAKTVINKVAPDMGEAALSRLLSAGSTDAGSTGLTGNVVRGAVQGAKDAATSPATYDRAATVGMTTGSPTSAALTAAGGVATGAANGARKGIAETIGNRAASDIAAGGDGRIGADLLDNGAVKSASAATKVAGQQAGQNDNVIDFVKNTFGLNTPAGQQNMPEELKAKIDADQTAVQDGKKDGRPTAEVPNIVTENGQTFLVTSSGRRVKLN